MITLTFPIILVQEDKNFIIDQQLIFNRMTRVAYSKLSKSNFNEKQCREVLKLQFKNEKLDSWYQQCAIRTAKAMLDSDVALGNKSRVFGGKRNLNRRAKGLITNEGWKECRLDYLNVIGEASKCGNRKFELYNNYVTYKPYKGKKITIQIGSLRKNYLSLYNQLCIASKQCKLAITVKLSSTKIHITFDDEILNHKPKKYTIKDRYAGIDLNPNYIGVSVFQNTKLIDYKLYDLKALTGLKSNRDKLNHETIEVAHTIGKWLTLLKVENVYLEELSFKPGDSKKGKSFNRLTKNQWHRKAFTQALSKHHKLEFIGAQYSSTIGNIMNHDLPDAVAASAEIARRGHNCYKLRNKKFYPTIISFDLLLNRLMKDEANREKLATLAQPKEFEMWKELHDWVKEHQLRYRVPLPSAESFRTFKSKRSCIFEITSIQLKCRYR